MFAASFVSDADLNSLGVVTLSIDKVRWRRVVSPRNGAMPGAGAGRRHILAVARELFMSRGYRAVSTREIAAAVGLTQPALYHHFGGKEALYIAVLEDELGTRSQAMWEAARLDAPAEQRLTAIVHAIADRSDHDLSQMFHDLRFEVSEQNRQHIREAFREAMMSPLLTVVAALEAEGVIAPSDRVGLSRPEVAMYVLSVIRMLTQSGVVSGERHRTPEQIAETTVRLIVSGVGSEGAH